MDPAVNIQLQEEFEKAQEEVMTKLRDTTPEHVKLQVYGLYKQAQIGDCNGPVPANQREADKYQAWNQHRGMPKVQAMQAYCKLAKEIQG